MSGRDRLIPPASPRSVCLVRRDEPGVTGTSRYVQRLELGLRERGIEVVSLVTRPTGKATRLMARAAGAASLDLLTVLSTYPARLRWPAVDLVHLTQHTYASALAISAPRRPLVITVHDIGRSLSDGPSSRALRDRVVSAADRVALKQLKRSGALIADSEWTRRTVAAELRLAAERVTVTPLGVDHLRFRPLPVPDDFRRRHRLDRAHRYLLYVGSDEPRKNLPTLWRALATLRHRFPNLVLLRVGRGYSPKARAELMRLSGELGIHDAIRYFDEVPDDELPFFYNTADVFVMPSLYEGFGLPALEAMASGTPVVVSSGGALAELVGPASGIQVDPVEPESLRVAIAGLLEDPQRAKALGERGRARASGFSWDSMVEQTIAVYDRTIDEYSVTR